MTRANNKNNNDLCNFYSTTTIVCTQTGIEWLMIASSTTTSLVMSNAADSSSRRRAADNGSQHQVKSENMLLAVGYK